MDLERLPLEVLESIFSYLGTLDILAASSVCKRWYYASLNINLWKGAVLRFNVEKREKAIEGLNVLKNSERPFSCIIFQDCWESCGHTSEEICTFFLHALEMCKVVGRRLSVLQFKNCSISGFHFADILVECPNLRHLSVVNCESLFSSEMWLAEPEDISRLKKFMRNVKILDLACNKSLTDMFFTRLAQVFTRIRFLSLEECPVNFQSVVFKRFYPRPDIEPSNVILTFAWIKEFLSCHAKRIMSVNFNGTNIDDNSLKALARMEGLQLECAFLSRCPLLTASGVRKFCHYQKKLKILNIQVPIALDKVLPEICTTLVELKQLSVGSSWPSDKVYSLHALQMQTLSKLEKVELDSCSEIVVLKFVDSLRSEAYPKLRQLNLSSNSIDDYLLIYMVPYLLHITHLDLSNTMISDKALIMISTHLVRLQVLQLSQCSSLTDWGLIGYFGAGPPLPPPREAMMIDTEEIKFGNREFLKWLVFDEDNPIALSNLKGLRELDLYGIRGISDDGVKVALVFRELRHLTIGGSSEITDEGLISIAKNNSSLEVLSFRDSSDVTANGIAQILSCLPRLKILDLVGCRQLTADVLSDLVKEFSFKLKYFI